MARFPVLVFGLLLLPCAPAAAEPAPLPAPIVDAQDLSVHVVETTCNSYLITCKRTGNYVLVDPGPGLDAALAAQKARGRVLQAIWITHEHSDHLSGLGALVPRLGVPVFAHGLARDAIAKRLDRWKARRRTRPAPPPPALPVRAVADGSVLQVGKTRWKVLHLPGHAPGSVGFLLEGRVLVAGDVLFKGSVGRTDFASGDPKAFATALGTKLWPLPDAVVVLPGHGPHTTIGAEKRTNRLFQDFARRGRGEATIARPWMGVRLDPTTTGRGLRLLEVVANSPAAAAGLAAGDVITTFDGVRMQTPQDLLGVLQKHAVSDTVALTFARGTTTKKTTLTFRARTP